MLLEKLVTSCRENLNGRKRKEKEKEKERAFLKNGSSVLETLVAACNGKPIPIRSFSIEEIRLATNINNSDRDLGLQTWHIGSLEGRDITVKKYKEGNLDLTDMAISSKMSAHKNVLKLIGCCLETPSPLLVYESTQNGTLADRIYAYEGDGTTPRQRQPIRWQSRLNIARDIAHAIGYLHHAFSKPIIHRNITPYSIVFDQQDIPKLNDFSLSISIPENETRVHDILCGTCGFVCPSYQVTGWITEKADVYSFGALLIVLLTGPRRSELFMKAADAELMTEGDSFEQQSQDSEQQWQDLAQPRWEDSVKEYIRKSDINEIADSAILEEGGGACVERQLRAVFDLAFTCMEFHPELRPSMIDVSKKLRWIGRSA